MRFRCAMAFQIPGLAPRKSAVAGSPALVVVDRADENVRDERRHPPSPQFAVLGRCSHFLTLPPLPEPPLPPRNMTEPPSGGSYLKQQAKTRRPQSSAAELAIVLCPTASRSETEESPVFATTESPPAWTGPIHPATSGLNLTYLRAFVKSF